MNRVAPMFFCIAATVSLFCACAFVLIGQVRSPNIVVSSSQAQFSSLEPSEATKTRLQPVLRGILAAWDKADVVCLGEDHGSKNDSDLRIALVQHPDFVRKVNAVIIEFADTRHQNILDRLVLDVDEIPREELRITWKDTGGKKVWESPIYEAFLRAVQNVNRRLPRTSRVRVIAGDNSAEMNRGRFIREAVRRELLDKQVKALAVYGSGHCERRGMGFPGELNQKYPGRIWAASTFYDVDEGRRVFGLRDEPALIAITNTEKEKLPVGQMFFSGRYNDTATVGDLFDAIIYYGSGRDIKVPADKR